MGKGNIKFHMKDNTMQTISSVFYIPELKSKLISMGQLQEKGYTIIIQAGYCKIHHPKKGLIAEARMTSNRMFPLYMQAMFKRVSLQKCMTQHGYGIFIMDISISMA